MIKLIEVGGKHLENSLRFVGIVRKKHLGIDTRKEPRMQKIPRRKRLSKPIERKEP
jgi:hypothetical protein